jgi:2-methylcitrate dehydratase PrpD
MTMQATRAHDPARPDAAEAIADHLAAISYEDLPEAVIRASKAAILDTLGCVLAGTGCDEVAKVGSLVDAWAGKPLCTLIGRGGAMASPEGAVLHNAAAIHQYDFDDVHDRAPCHPGSTSVVPALAMAEARGGATGKALIAAVALGSDLTSRVSLAIRGKVHDYPWFRAPVVGLFGATAAAAHMLGATSGQHLNALGLALPMVGGTFASLQHPGSNVRSLRDGLAYRNGVLAAELAVRGICGDREVFEGPFGFFQAFFKGEYDREAFVGGLGQHYETERVSLKPWPSIRHLHTTLTAVLQIMEQRDLRFEDVRQVDIHVGKVNRDRCRPVETGSIPALRMDLLGNLQFAVANAIRHRNVPLAVYRDPALADDIVRHAMPKVRWTFDPAMDGPLTFERGLVYLTTTAGEIVKGECDKALGHPENPMSEARRHAKFTLCAEAAARPPAAARIREIIDAVEHLDRLDEVRSLAALLA